MNRAAAFNQLVQDFRTWLAANGAEPCGYPDVVFDPPAPPLPYLRWTLNWSGSVSASIGMIEDRHTGLIFVELFWPSGMGYKDVNAKADLIAAYYRTYSADGGRLRTKGVDDNARPWVSVAPGEPGYTRRVVNVPVRLMEAI